MVESLSDSTARTNREKKLREYQMIESLQHYLLVSRREARAELYTRIGDGHWDYVAVEGPDGVLSLPALSISLSLADIYEGIEFEPLADQAE